MTGWPADVLPCGIVLAGASVQWLTGMGFALVAVPALILVLGPGTGVALANCAAGAISVVGIAEGWRNVRLVAMVPLIAAAACTVPVGTWTAAQLPEPMLLIGVGALVSTAVVLVLRGLRIPALRGIWGAVAAGAVGGFMNSSAAVGGPPLSLYAVNAGWTMKQLDRVVDAVAGGDGRATPAAELDGDLPRGVAGRGEQPDAGGHFGARTAQLCRRRYLGQVELAGLADRMGRVAEHGCRGSGACAGPFPRTSGRPAP